MEPVQLGWQPGTRRFALLAPRATSVVLLQRAHPDGPHEQQTVCEAQHSPWGTVFVAQGHDPTRFCYYRFAVEQDGQIHQLADPWGLAQARQNRLGTPTWSVAQALPARQSRPYICLPMAEQVVLEVHVRDATALWKSAPTSVVPGSYAALAHPDSPLLAHARSLSATAVELLPTATFPLREPSPADPDDQGRQWNPTGVNHWGYMPSFLLAVSERYAQGWTADPDVWLGVHPDGSFADPALELRDAVDALHAQGFAAVADVVWNHVSNADRQPLLLLDPGNWFVRNPDGSLRNHSGCGNDLNTAQPAMRALVLAAAHRWFAELGFDGLRLDLAELLDNETLRQIHALAHQLHPTPLLFAEPWSMGGYRPAELAALGYAVWNDRFRNGWKGHHPQHGQGLAFGRTAGGAGLLEGLALLRGWPAEPLARQVRPTSHPDLAALDRQVHYLESHDDHTVGDFVRLALAIAPQGPDWTALYPLRADELRVHQLLAAALCLSSGPLLLAAGQSWARPRLGPEGALVGNAWNRDDAASHLDWRGPQLGRALDAWWRALLRLRRQWLQPGLGEAGRWLPWLPTEDGGVGWLQRTLRGDVAVALNLDTAAVRWWSLPGGPWQLLLANDPGVDIVPTQPGVAIGVPAGAVAVLVRPPPQAKLLHSG